MRKVSWILAIAMLVGCGDAVPAGGAGGIAPPGGDLSEGDGAGLGQGGGGAGGGGTGVACWKDVGDANGDGALNVDDCLWAARCDRPPYMLADENRDGTIDFEDCVERAPFVPPTGGGEGDGGDPAPFVGGEGEGEGEGEGGGQGGMPAAEGEGEGDEEIIGADPNAEEGQIRLVPGPTLGRVEVFHDGRWGTVCDDYWDLVDGRVACQQLGFQRAEQVFLAAHFGQGRGEIWLDSLQCTGQEEKLVDCQSPGFGVHNCGHHEDAGVVCEE